MVHTLQADEFFASFNQDPGDSIFIQMIFKWEDWKLVDSFVILIWMDIVEFMTITKIRPIIVDVLCFQRELEWCIWRST